MKHLLSLKTLRAGLALAAFGLLSACASTPNSSSMSSADFGEFPDNYQTIVKNYLSQNQENTRIPLNVDGIEFLNEPNKFVFDQFSTTKTGYRVCTVVPTKLAYNFRSHFFLVNDGKVTAHLHDAGLLDLSDKFCNVERLALERKATNSHAVATTANNGSLKYITCQAGKDEVFFAFDPKKELLTQQSNGNNVAQFDVTELSDTFIVAEANSHRISINRISGTLIHSHNGAETQASCVLKGQQQF